MCDIKTIETNNGVYMFVCDIKTENNNHVYLYKNSDSDTLTLHLFIKRADSFFYSTQVSFDQIDSLNRGKITLDFCFRGARNTPKQGMSFEKIGEDWIEKIIPNIFDYYDFGATYVPEFVDDNHGVGLLSLIYQTNFLSIVLDKSSNSEPLMDIGEIKKIVNQFKEVVQKLPFNIKKEGKMISFSDRHSTRISFEIGDFNDKDDTLTDQSDLHESNEAINLLAKCCSATILNEDDIAKVANVCGNDSSLMKVFQRVITHVNANNNSIRELSLIKFDEGEVESVLSETIDEKLETTVTCNTNKIIEKIEENTKKTREIDCVGYFEMIDITGKREFKFRTNIDDKTKTISGHCSINLSDKQIDLIVNNKVRRYKVKLVCEFNYDEKQVSNITYTLIDLELLQEDEQLSIFD